MGHNLSRGVNSSKKLTIYYDGSCPMCTAFVADVVKKTNIDLIAKDITIEVLPSGITTEAVQREIHVIDDEGTVYKNAEAILVILDDVNKWERFTWLGRLPLIKKLLPLGYNIVARNRHFLFGHLSRLWWLKLVTVLGLIAGLLLSTQLWIRTSFFPTVPVSPALPVLSATIEGTMFVFILGLSFVSLLTTKPQKYLLAVVGILFLSVLFDVIRFQPWVFHYSSVMLVLGLYSWDKRDTSSHNAFLQTVRLIIAGIYIYSGLQKISISFFTSVFPWMVEPISDLLPEALQSLTFVFGVFVPFIEIAIGVGLLVRPWRNKALVGVFCMLIFVLFTLGPLGHNWNNVVWPWNITIALSALIIFYRTDTTTLKNIFIVRNFSIHKIMLVLFIIMPALSFVGWWDSYPSYSLYSGNVTSGKINYENASDIPYEMYPHISKDTNRNYFTWVDVWSVDELNVPVYPEVRVFKSIFSDICKLGMENINLEVRTKVTLLENSKTIFYTCSDVVLKY